MSDMLAMIIAFALVLGVIILVVWTSKQPDLQDLDSFGGPMPSRRLDSDRPVRR